LSDAGAALLDEDIRRGGAGDKSGELALDADEASGAQARCSASW
jgi:hypothetical protein